MLPVYLSIDEIAIDAVELPPNPIECSTFPAFSTYYSILSNFHRENRKDSSQMKANDL